ncbi:hypothetical protein DFH27DRAFT_610057 [Peziza echinospora]|nr:hypothetical protein DFH27DRAFT_610057 [Peziza echinospora]
MAASNPPLDPNTLANWETAFEQYSVPQVRALHRQLQSNLSVNREKLRALVGESYRDLLRTAEKIIEMDASSQQVESNLGDASRNCSWRLLEKKAKNTQIEKYTFAAQLSVLQGCPKELAKILHRGGSCILAARVFVISRLLLKSLQSKGPIPLVTSLRDQLTSIRTVLLKHIDEQLRLNDTPTPVLIESMCALALVKTSSPADLLRHFLNIRSSAISAALNPASFTSSPQFAPMTSAVINALALFDRTLRDTEILFPKKISEALHQLKSKPLFENLELRAIPGLNLEIHERWLPEDIRGFIPWVRHDELERSKVNDPVKTWAGKELEVLNTSIKAALEGVDSIQIAVEFRKEILDLWRGNNTLLLNVVIGSEAPRRKFRDLLNERLEGLLNVEAGRLKAVGATIGKLVRDLDEKNTDSTSLWSDALVNMRTSNGALAFRQAVKAAIKGHDTSIQAVLEAYTSWRTQIVQSYQLVNSIRNTVKIDEFDDADDEFGLEMDSAQDGVEDADRLVDALKTSLGGRYKELETDLEKLVGACEVDLKNHLQATTIRATFLYRTIREIRLNPPRDPKPPSTAANKSHHLQKPLISLKQFYTPLLTRLQTLISTGTSASALALLSKSLQKRKWEKEAPSRPLWEGTPPLPVQPSPDIFKFLHELVTRMAGVGSDVWTPRMVGRLRGLVAGEVWMAVGEVVGGMEVRRVLVEEEERESIEKAEEGASKDDETTGNEGGEEKASGEGEEQKEEDPSSTTAAEGNSTPQPPKDEAQPQPQPESEPEPQSAPPPVPQAPEISETWVLQLLYDVAYLKKALYCNNDQEATSPPPPQSTVPGLGDLRERFNIPSITITSTTAEVNEGDGDGGGQDYIASWIESKSMDYWRRTSLLFSLLGSSVSAAGVAGGV